MKTHIKQNKSKDGQTNGEKRHTARVPLAERLSRRLDIPADVFCGGLTLELRGRGELYIMGCRRIVYYSTERISLALRDSILTVEGRRLSCITYFNSQVGICGRVDSILFSALDDDSSNRATNTCGR